MIASLRIENFALIDSIQIDFTNGFTVITGETGSGKSILLNALNLILGERANFSVIGNSSDKSSVEAEINISEFGMKAFFEENELDYFDKTIVRREIYKQGRSRAFINDTPVQLNTLKAFTSQLIHIHSQYNTLELKDLNFQLNVLDVLAEVVKERDAFEILYNSHHEREKLIVEKKKDLADAMAQADYNDFQLSELETLNLLDQDFEAIKAEVLKGENADDIRNGFGEIIDALNNERGIIDQLNSLKASLVKKKDYHPVLENIYGRLESILIDVNDIGAESDLEIEKIEFNPGKLEELISSLDVFNRILQKHQLNSQEELVALMNELSASSVSHTKLAEEIDALEKLSAEQLAILNEKATALHQKRLKAIPEIENKIKRSLAELKLENTELIFSLTETPKLNVFGHSKLEILFSPNIGVSPVPVHQAASGGELSRVMLALQSLMSSKIQLATILFDEIDTGVSGDVAQKMGTTLKKMGEGMQVIAITHLPQVAAKGGQHLKVMKEVVNGKTTSSVVDLSAEERVNETARLMSGDEINQSALENAKALMK